MNYHNITHDDMLNGDGLRTVLWVAGCAHACPGCHNMQTWAPDSGIPFDQAAREELYAALSHDYIAGLTLSGGDPLYPGNRETIADLIADVRGRFPDKTIWLYTGYHWEDIHALPLIAQVDVLVDGPFVQALHDPQLRWRGSSNQRVIDVAATRASGQICLHSETARRKKENKNGN